MTTALEKRIKAKREKAMLEKQSKQGQSSSTEPASVEPSLTISPSIELAGLMMGNNKDPDSIIVEIDSIVVNPQVRKEFTAASLEELADDIAEHGQDTPVIVRPLGQGRYELVAGERRLRAKKILQLRDPSNINHRMIRATEKTLNDQQKENRQLAENIHREDLKPLELAEVLAAQKETYGYTDEQLAKNIKKDRSFVTRHLGLLKLSPELQYLISTGEVKVNPALQKKESLVEKIVSDLPKGLRESIDTGERSKLDALKARDTYIDTSSSESNSPLETNTSKPERLVKVSVSLDAAEAMVDLLALLATDLGLNPVDVTKSKNKMVRKELLAALDSRSQDILQAYRSK